MDKRNNFLFLIFFTKFERFAKCDVEILTKNLVENRILSFCLKIWSKNISEKRVKFWNLRENHKLWKKINLEKKTAETENATTFLSLSFPKSFNFFFNF